MSSDGEWMTPCFLQPEKARGLMVYRSEFGKDIVLRRLQSANASSPISLMFLWIVTPVRKELRNAQLSIIVVSFFTWKNALSPLQDFRGGNLTNILHPLGIRLYNTPSFEK